MSKRTGTIQVGPGAIVISEQESFDLRRAREDEDRAKRLESLAKRWVEELEATHSLRLAQIDAYMMEEIERMEAERRAIYQALQDKHEGNTEI